jgi:diguanylate cyclase (GGDEF)-like protein/PAS domain S-box-containing protein
LDVYSGHPIKKSAAIARWYYGIMARVLSAYAKLVSRWPRRSNADEPSAREELAELQAVDERYRWFLAGSRDWLFEVGLDGRYRYASPNCATFSGYEPSDLVGKSIFDFLHPDDCSSVMAIVMTAVSGDRTMEFSARYLTKDGRYRWFEGKGHPRKRSTFDIRFVIVAHDVTDRRAAEEAARESEARLLLHVEQTPVAVIRWDAEGKVVDWNPAAESIFGYTRDEVIGQDGIALLMPEAVRRTSAVLAEQSGDETSRRTHENITKDGRRIICEWSDTRIVAADGSVAGVTSIVQNVTDRVHAQEALRDSEAAIRSLYEVTSAPHIDFHEKVDAVLTMGCAFFHLPMGVISLVKGDELEVLAAEFPGDRLRRGARFPLASMYSGRIVAEGETLAIHNGTKEDWTAVPAAHDEFGLQSFIGTPVRVKGEIYGTIAFGGKDARRLPFTETEIDFIRLIAQWLGLAMERQAVEEELRHNALHDALTGLPNQRLFYDRLQVAMVQAKRTGDKLAVCFVDLDRFKVVNDTLGHRIGDALLKEVAARLALTLREGDTLARLGGDEFVVLLPQVTDTNAASKIAQRLLESLQHPVTVDNRELFVTASVGVSLYPDSGLDPESLVKNADHAMYRAKEIGRDTYQVYAAKDGEANEMLALETSLRRAIKNDELRLFYQPQIELASGKIVSVEALVRWQHPERGLVPPLDFIPLAEETGLILPIGAWVIGEACRQIAQWQRLGFPPVRVAVNVSARQFRHKSFVESVQSVLEANGVEPSQLEIELTESVTMYAGEAELQALARLKFLGVRLAIDDFGTGYASLSNLKRFPIDVVKIDRSFVNDCLNSTDDAAIVKAVVSMGHALHLQVVAEGVETREQMAFLQLLGCDGAQGYLIGAPMPADKFERLVAQRTGALESLNHPNSAA